MGTWKHTFCNLLTFTVSNGRFIEFKFIVFISSLNSNEDRNFEIFFLNLGLAFYSAYRCLCKSETIKPSLVWPLCNRYFVFFIFYVKIFEKMSSRKIFNLKFFSKN